MLERKHVGALDQRLHVIEALRITHGRIHGDLRGRTVTGFDHGF